MRTFSKAKHLCLKRDIDALFSSHGQSFTAWPLRMKYAEAAEGPTKVLISVPKRLLRHAVDRNRAKRQVREAYRLHQDLLSPEKSWHLAFIWLSDTPQESAIVHQRMTELLTKLENE